MEKFTKRMGVGALIRNPEGKILIVKPCYKYGWLLVGGMMKSYETPTEALRRGIKEEIDLDLEVGKLLCVDFGPKDKDSVVFVFDCGVIDSDKQISYADGEIIDHKFVDEETAVELLRIKGARRTPLALEALKNNTVVYIEDNES